MGQKGIHKEMLQVYMQNCVLYKAVHYWVQTFCQGHIQIADKAQSGVLLRFPNEAQFGILLRLQEKYVCGRWRRLIELTDNQ